MKDQPSYLLVLPPVPIPNRNPQARSLKTVGGQTPKTAKPVYSGDSMLGIAAMHKSNLVPVFSSEEAQDVAKMRRN